MDKKNKSRFLFDVVIIGGLGHVGLPLGLVFAKEGLKTCLIDIDPLKAAQVKKGIMPFIEYGAEPILKEVLKNKKLEISLDLKSVAEAKFVIVAIGTPIDEYLNPKTRVFLEIFQKIKKYL
ncbi:MAG: nucleotide sugar dehydrogenase, partial [Candidatus Omnitrophica bacterium CG11_big_fil_rev_8_21_14_0_20_43_6]